MSQLTVDFHTEELVINSYCTAEGILSILLREVSHWRVLHTGLNYTLIGTPEMTP